MLAVGVGGGGVACVGEGGVLPVWMGWGRRGCRVVGMKEVLSGGPRAVVVLRKLVKVISAYHPSGAFLIYITNETHAKQGNVNHNTP